MDGFVAVFRTRKGEYIARMSLKHRPMPDPGDVELFMRKSKIRGKSEKAQAREIASIFARVRRVAYGKHKLAHVINLPRNSEEH